MRYADQIGLVRIVKRELNKIQYRPRLINGCLAAVGLRTGSWSSPARRVPSAVSRDPLDANEVRSVAQRG